MLMATIRRWLRATGGLAATEFALISPALILLYAGSAELSDATMTNRKLELLSRTLADLASQEPTSQQTTSTPAPANAITQATVQSILAAATALLAPAPLTTLKMTLTAVDIVNNPVTHLCCQFNVRWSYTQGGTLRPCGVPLTPVSSTAAPTPSTVPSSMTPPVVTMPIPLSMLIADVSYTYQGVFSSQWISFASGMSRTSYMLPRSTGQVIVQAPLTPTGTQSGAICY